MSLLNSAIHHQASLPAEVWAACFQITRAAHKKARNNERSHPWSRKKLAKDLNNDDEKFKVAPEPVFVRDTAPHPEARDWREMRMQDRTPVTDRQREARERDRERRGRWGRRERERRTSSWAAEIEPIRQAERRRRAFSGARFPDFDRPSASAVRRTFQREGALDAQRPPPRLPVYNPLSDEFDIAAKSVTTRGIPTAFASPPLMEGLLTSVRDVLGPAAKPTPIQALSMKHLFKNPVAMGGSKQPTWRQFLLASETGSGKSMAYLLPMLQDLKQSELDQPAPQTPAPGPSTPLNPRALVLAPTHELARQLSGFAKALLHSIKLRVQCASQANMPSTPRHQVSASQMAHEMDDTLEIDEIIHRGANHPVDNHPVDVLVGTPSRVLELFKGRGWDYEQPNLEDQWGQDEKGRARRARVWTIGKPEMGLSRIEWVVVDEADVLFDPDFQESTRRILAEISSARGHPVPYDVNMSLDVPKAPLDYPFNLLLTSATIPNSLASYLDTHHPSLVRLASPNLHRLPTTLKTEYAAWTGGNHNADIEHRLRRVWGEDIVSRSGRRSKVLIFCNKSTKVEELGQYLAEKGVPNVALTSTSETRRRGSNHHLAGFLRVKDTDSGVADVPDQAPHVMITTSLLSRGLDFAPDIRHVFIVDEPRNMIDFLHRAGRSARAGAQGTVVIFGKSKGRGSDKTKEMRERVGALAA